VGVIGVDVDVIHVVPHLLPNVTGVTGVTPE